MTRRNVQARISLEGQKGMPGWGPDLMEQIQSLNFLGCTWPHLAQRCRPGRREWWDNYCNCEYL